MTLFYSLTGNVVYKGLTEFAVECGGVAFRCQSSFATLSEVIPGEKMTVYTYLNVREDALDLFGFTTEYELEWFKMLITVNGVGPKAALAVLSELSPDRLALCISASDVKAITKAQGIGPKIAQRIILDLKDKVKGIASVSDNSSEISAVSAAADMPNTSEAVAALTMLGYTQSDAAVAVSKLDSSLSVENLIKGALKLLSLG